MSTIDKMELERAVLSMGYRRPEPRKDIWCKPFGYSLLNITILGDKIVMDQWFRDSNNETALWTSKELHSDVEEHDSLVSQIKYFEAFSVHQISAGHEDKYQFLTTVEAAQLLMERE